MVDQRRRTELEKLGDKAVADVMRVRDRAIPDSWTAFVGAILPPPQAASFEDPFGFVEDLLRQGDVPAGDKRDLRLLCGLDQSASRRNLTGRRNMVCERRGCNEKTLREDEPRLRAAVTTLAIDRLSKVARDADSQDILRCSDEWLERLAFLQANGELSSAADLGQLIVGLASETPLYRGTIVHAEAALALGHVLRDQGRLSGPNGALAAYRSSAAILREVDEPQRLAYARLMTGVCAEMSSYLELARAIYRRLSTSPQVSASTRARAKLWLGTTATKLGQYESARQAISNAIADYEKFGLSQQLREVYIKLGLLEARAGNVERALAILEDVRRGNPDRADLTSVRLHLATADVLGLVGESAAALLELDAVWPVIEAHELAHQASSHNRIYERITGEKPPVGHQLFEKSRFSPMTPQEASNLQREEGVNRPGFSGGSLL
jgi:tetratricopeptide (TPR) repeat protein